MNTLHAYENPFVAEFYDHIVSFSNRRDVSFFINQARRVGGPILEIGCGTGRVLIPTARAGIPVVGLDNSSPMLNVCRKNLSLESNKVLSMVEGVEHTDMRCFSLKRKFNLITFPFYTFNYLVTLDDQLCCLSQVRQHLRDKGILILDLPNPYLPYLTDQRYLDEFGEEPEFLMPDGRRVKRQYRITRRDLSNQVVYGEILYYVSQPRGTKEKLVNSSAVRYLFRYEAEHLLMRCGFKLTAVYSDYDGNAFGSAYPGELVLIANKF